MIARMTGDRPVSEEAEAPVGGSAGGLDPVLTGEPAPHASTPTGSLSGAEAPTDTGPEPDGESRAGGGSMFDAPDNSWRELELSDQAAWRAAPLWPGSEPAAAGNGDASHERGAGVSSPEARELAPDGAGLADPTAADSRTPTAADSPTPTAADSRTPTIPPSPPPRAAISPPPRAATSPPRGRDLATPEDAEG